MYVSVDVPSLIFQFKLILPQKATDENPLASSRVVMEMIQECSSKAEIFKLLDMIEDRVDSMLLEKKSASEILQ